MQDDTHSAGADSEPAPNRPSPPPPPPPLGPPVSNPMRARPRRPLPTGRVTFAKQFRCLLSYGLESRQGKVPVRMETVAKAVGLNASTVSLCNPFFVDVGLLAKSGRGLFTPSAEVLAMVDAHQWNPDTAPERLAPILRASWAAEALEPRLRLGPIGMDDAIQTLAETVGAVPEYKAALGIIVDYLCISGVTLRDGHQLSWAPASSPTAETSSTPEPEGSEEQTNVNSPSGDESQKGIPAHMPGMGGISFTVSIQVDASEISGWSPDSDHSLLWRTSSSSRGTTEGRP